MDKAHNNRGPVYGPVCNNNYNRGAPPGVIIPNWPEPAWDKVYMYQLETFSRQHMYLVTHRPRDFEARGRPPSLWRRKLPGKPASKPVMGEVRPVVNTNFEILMSDFQLFTKLIFNT